MHHVTAEEICLRVAEATWALADLAMLRDLADYREADSEMLL